MPVPRKTAGPDEPSPARIYQFLNGDGYFPNYFDADKDLAETMIAADPGLRKLARANRRFVTEAVRSTAAQERIAQFLDVGCGLPSRPAVHEMARDVFPSARVAYADIDPQVISSVQTARDVEGWDRVAVIEADAADPASVLKDGAFLDLINLRQPLCVVLGGTLSAMPAEAARNAVAGFTEAIAPGSAVIISCASYSDRALGERMSGLFQGAGTWLNHSPEDIASFFAAGRLRLVHGMVMDVECWPACPAAGPRRGKKAAVLGGVGIKR